MLKVKDGIPYIDSQTLATLVAQENKAVRKRARKAMENRPDLWDTTWEDKDGRVALLCLPQEPADAVFDAMRNTRENRQAREQVRRAFEAWYRQHGRPSHDPTEETKPAEDAKPNDRIQDVDEFMRRQKADGVAVSLRGGNIRGAPAGNISNASKAFFASHELEILCRLITDGVYEDTDAERGLIAGHLLDLCERREINFAHVGGDRIIHQGPHPLPPEVKAAVLKLKPDVLALLEEKRPAEEEPPKQEQAPEQEQAEPAAPPDPVPMVWGYETVQTINAEDLHSWLEIATKFADWIVRRVNEYGFVEGRDFLLLKSEKKTGRGGHNKTTYHISVPMAKELCMVERNERGKAARLHYIACEERLKEELKLKADHRERPPVDSTHIKTTFTDMLVLAKEFGFEHSQALRRADTATRNLGCPSVFELLGIERVESDAQDAMLIPSQIGKYFNLTAEQTNRWMEKLKLQYGYHDHNMKKRWRLSDLGKSLGGIYYDVAIAGKATTEHQIRWPASILDYLSERH